MCNPFRKGLVIVGLASPASVTFDECGMGCWEMWTESKKRSNDYRRGRIYSYTNEETLGISVNLKTQTIMKSLDICVESIHITCSLWRKTIKILWWKFSTSGWRRDMLNASLTWIWLKNWHFLLCIHCNVARAFERMNEHLLHVYQVQTFRSVFSPAATGALGVGILPRIRPALISERWTLSSVL